MDPYHLFTASSERVVVAGRAVLALFALLAVYIDPSQPTQLAPIAYALLVAYLGYAVLVLLLTYGGTARIGGRAQGVVTHVVDILCFSAVMAMTEGPTSPFFVLFSFTLLVATLRWK